MTATKAAGVRAHRGEGWGGRATARVSTVATDTVARLLRMAGRHAERVHAQRGRAGTPRAVEGEAPGRCVKKSRRAATPRRQRALALLAWAHGRTSRRGPWGTRPRSDGGRGISQRSAPRPRTARRPPSLQLVDVESWALPPAVQGGPVVRSCAGPKAWRRARGNNTRKGVGSSASRCGACRAKHGGSLSCLS